MAGNFNANASHDSAQYILWRDIRCGRFSSAETDAQPQAIPPFVPHHSLDRCEAGRSVPHT